MEALPPGYEVYLDSDQLRAMSLHQLKETAQKLGLSLEGLEDRESSLYTRIMQFAVEVTPSDA